MSPTGAHDAARVAALDRLLLAERAGASAVRLMAAEAEDARQFELLRRVGRDEAWCCGMLTRHIERLGGRVSRGSGDFLDKVRACETPAERLRLLVRGQQWVVRRVLELRAEVGDDAALVHDLDRMLAMHRRNVSRCETLLPAADGDTP